jgi:outer membrane protein assembly factor BamB
MHDIWAAGSLVFVSHGLHELSCYDRESGGLLWRTDLNDLLGGRDKKRAKIRLFGPILVEGTLLLTTSDGRMLGVDPTTGEVMGSVSIPATYTRPMVYRGRLHIMGTDSTFYGLSGLPVWEKRTDGKEVPSSDIRPVVLGRS